MVALEVLSAGWTAVFFAVAFICFLLATFLAPLPRVNLIAAGLAFWVFVLLWNAIASA